MVLSLGLVLGLFVSVMFLHAPDMRPNFFDKQISHSGRVIQQAEEELGRLL